MESKIKDLIDYFIMRSNDSWDQLTQLKLQKLLYYVQSWYLAINWQPLFSEDFQAWIHWPVLRSVYDKYIGFKPWDSINIEIDNEWVCAKFTKNEIAFLDELSNEYLWCTWFELEQMTHNEDPWKITRWDMSIDQRSERIIDKWLIFKYYSSKLIRW